MTLRVKSIIFSAGSLLLMIMFIVVFYNYKSANNKLIDLITVLAELKHSAHEIRIEVLASQGRGMDTEKINRVLTSAPNLSQKLRGTLLSGEDIARLVDVELSFIRIASALNSYPAEKTLEQPLLAQINNETVKIEQTVNLFLKPSEIKINILKIKTELLDIYNLPYYHCRHNRVSFGPVTLLH